MFRKFFLLLLPISALIAVTPVNPLSAQNRVEKRCGWFQNPTPSNAWLRDRDGLWLIASQAQALQVCRADRYLREPK